MVLAAACVVVTDYEYLSREPLLATLADAGIRPVFGACRTPGEVLKLAGDADAILVARPPSRVL